MPRYAKIMRLHFCHKSSESGLNIRKSSKIEVHSNMIKILFVCHGRSCLNVKKCRI
nr:MAG TPA: Glutaredoxin arsenate reductase [Caudoviricetes sp.]